MTADRFTLHVLSDAVGDTAASVAKAVASQFPTLDFRLVTTSMVRSVEDLNALVAAHEGEEDYLFLYTLVRGELHDEMVRLSTENDIHAVDVLGAPTFIIERMTELKSSGRAGAIHRTDEKYFRRIEAMEFAVSHDDGLRPEDLGKADVVIIGVSRSSKTPLSMYLAYRGVKVANIPLTPGTCPPEELNRVNPEKIFGLMTTPDVLMGIRKSRMKELGTYVRDYAEIEAVEKELREARDLMRSLGCLVINTANRAIEEVAGDILRYLCVTD